MWWLERKADRLALVIAAHVGNHNVRNVGSAAGLFGRATDRLGVVAMFGVAGVLGRFATGTVGAVMGVHVAIRCSAIASAAALREIGTWRGGVAIWTLQFPVVVVIVA